MIEVDRQSLNAMAKYEILGGHLVKTIHYSELSQFSSQELVKHYGDKKPTNIIINEAGQYMDNLLSEFKKMGVQILVIETGDRPFYQRAIDAYCENAYIDPDKEKVSDIRFKIANRHIK